MSDVKRAAVVYQQKAIGNSTITDGEVQNAFLAGAAWQRDRDEILCLSMQDKWPADCARAIRAQGSNQETRLGTTLCAHGVATDRRCETCHAHQENSK